MGDNDAARTATVAWSRDARFDRMNPRRPILPYSLSETAYVEYDPGVVEAAKHLIGLIEQVAPWVHAEHIGSTAIPGCAGKGIVDLMVLYPTGRLAATRDALDGLGFQPQQTGHAFPEDRPMRVGAFDHDDTRYQSHVHVIAMDSPEVSSLRQFRDALRDNGALRHAYEAKKREIIKSGVRERADYTHAKGEFIRSVIGPS
jgi:GrpB-like predicted nucleotidyltransferase (UPF0157 family)